MEIVVKGGKKEAVCVVVPPLPVIRPSIVLLADKRRRRIGANCGTIPRRSNKKAAGENERIETVYKYLRNRLDPEKFIKNHPTLSMALLYHSQGATTPQPRCFWGLTVLSPGRIGQRTGKDEDKGKIPR